jgi:hypothetical protein
VFFVSLWYLYSASIVSFIFLLSQILYFCFLEFLECLLYIWVDLIQYPLYEILIDYL